MARVFGRRALVAVLACAAMLGYGLLPRDERRISSVVDELCAKASRARDPAALAALQTALAESLLEEVTVQAPELGQDSSGLSAVLDRTRGLLTAPPLTFSLVDAEVHVSGALARVNGNLIVTERGSGEQHRDLRLTELRLRKVRNDWRIEAIRIDPVRPAEPEARP